MNHKTLKCLRLSAIALVAATAMTFVSCDDEVEMENRFTFKGEHISTYLINNPDRFSSFTYILDKAKMGKNKETSGSLLKTLSTYGSYTCFAPTNEAIDSFLQKQSMLHAAGERTGITSPYLEDISDSMALEIAKNHIIEKGFKTIDINEGAFPKNTMNGRFTTVGWTKDGRYPLLNNTTRIIEQDLEKENGYIQVVDGVLNPSQKFLHELIGEQEEFSIFHQAIIKTGIDSLLSIYELDPDYDNTLTGPSLDSEPSTSPYPFEKKQRYTVLIEPNTLLQSKGINDLDELIAFAQTWYDDEDPDNFKSPENALHKFVLYHIIDRQLQYSSSTGPGGFIMYGYENVQANYSSTRNLNQNFDSYEYYETMLPYTMIKVTKPYTNPSLRKEIVLNYAQEKGTKCFNDAMAEHINVIVESEQTTVNKYPETLANFQNGALNGIIYTIDRILIYNENEMAGNILNERIRTDVSALFPELTNNGVRWDISSDGNIVTYIPNDYCKYFEPLGDDTEVFYLRPHQTWGSSYANYQGDELIVEGKYDFRYRIPHVPAGTYEIRFGYAKGYYRGVCQFYVDGKIAGIPVDLRWNDATDKLVGWFSDTGLTEDQISDNDKAMRNRGYMKGPASIVLEDNDGIVTMRSGEQPLRKIIGTYRLDKGDHWLRFKDVSENSNGVLKQFEQDYLELVPVNVINDPLKPEDRN